MKVQYIGCEDDGIEDGHEVTQYGYGFAKNGEAVSVPDDSPEAAKFEAHPHFSVKATRKGADAEAAA